jgi:hypothetical protein
MKEDMYKIYVDGDFGEDEFLTKINGKEMIKGKMNGGRGFKNPIIDGIYRNKNDKKFYLLLDIAKNEVTDNWAAIYRSLEFGVETEAELFFRDLEEFLKFNEYDEYLTDKYKKSIIYKEAVSIAKEKIKEEEEKESRHYYGSKVAQDIQIKLLEKYRKAINEIDYNSEIKREE